MYPMNMPRVPQTAPLTRKQFRAIQAAMKRAYAPGRAERIQAAIEKRSRKNAKRLSNQPLTGESK